VALTCTSRGTGNNGTGATSLSVTGRTATLAAGSLGVLCIALDNAGSGGATAAAPATATDSKGNVWTRQQSLIYDNGAASAGIEGAIYTAPITVALLTSDTLTLTWIAGVTVVAKAWTWYEVIPAANSEAVYLTGGGIAGATAANAQVTTASVAVGDAVIAAYFAEGVSAVTGDADATNGSWGAQQTDTVGATTSGVRVASQQKVQTTAASTQSYDVTVASQDRIAGYIVVHAQHTATAQPTMTGGGVLVPSLTTARARAAAAAAGGGVVVPSLTTARSRAGAHTGGGVLSASLKTARARSGAQTGGGVLAVVAAGGRASSATAAGGGVATLTVVAGRASSTSATGAGVLVIDYTRSAATENHDGTFSVTGGGVVVAALTTSRAGTLAATGGGAAVVSAVAGRTSSLAATGAGAATVAGSSQRSSAQALTGGGAASPSLTSARQLAAMLSGGGVLAPALTSARRAAVASTGGGSAVVDGTQLEVHSSSPAMTGGGTATLDATTARQAAPTATGAGALPSRRRRLV
jgi:hypothetical protein